MRVNNRIIDLKKVKKIVVIIRINHIVDIKIVIKKNLEKEVTRAEVMKMKKKTKEVQVEAEAEVIAEVEVQVRATVTVNQISMMMTMMIKKLT